MRIEFISRRDTLELFVSFRPENAAEESYITELASILKTTKANVMGYMLNVPSKGFDIELVQLPSTKET